MKLMILPLSPSSIMRSITDARVYVAALTCVVLFTFFFTVPAFAGEAGWSQYTAVTELTPTDQQRYEFRLSLLKNPAGCKSPDTFYQDYDSVGSDRMYRLLLQALINEKKVRVHVTGRCELNGYAEISAVSMVR